ncbi:LysR family transcriptional regulator [Pigmentiphaga litoralis]|uniref:LysR family transcriptional regulator n=1 Tax=Pigmentiphaga litoralis TaxID=516702 RepID=UPI003B43856E
MHPQLDSRLLSRLRLRHLELLDALGETRNIHHAAPRLNLTQPAASKLLQEIETLYRTRLFERHPRGVTPTDAGASAIRWARQLLFSVGESVAEAHLMARGATGRVRIGALPVAIPMLVTRMLDTLAQTAPDLVVTLVEGGGDTVLPALARGELDLVLGRLTGDVHTTQFTHHVLYQEPVCLVASPTHPLIARGRIGFQDLVDARWILPPELAPLRRELDAMLLAHGVHRPMPRIETMSLLLMQILLARGDRIAAMPLHVAEHYAAQHLLGILDLDLPIRMPPVGMILLAGARPAAAVQVVIDTIQAVAQAHLPTPPLADSPHHPAQA